MANKKVNIDITTTSNTSGADKAAASLAKIEAQQAKAAARAEEVAVREAARAARAEAAAQRAADVETRRQERLARQAEAASQRKENAIKREEAARERAAAKAEKAAAAEERSKQRVIDVAEKAAKKEEEIVSKASANEERLAKLAADKETRQKASRLQQAGFQVTDIATQVSGGTSLLQSFSQQAPQLLGAFGPQGAIAGAFLGLGLLAVKAFSDAGDSAEALKEKADFLAAGIKDGLGAAIKTISEDYDFGKTNMENAQAYSQTLFDSFNKIAEKQREFAKQSLENSKQLRKTELELSEALGFNMDRRNESLRSSIEEAAIRKQQLDSDIAAQNEIIAAAQFAKQQADEKKKAQEDIVVQKKLEYEADLQRIAQLDAEYAKLKKVSEERKSVWEWVKSAGTAFATGDFGIHKPGDVGAFSTSTQAAFTAQQKLKGPQQTTEMTYLRDKVKTLEEGLQANGQYSADLVKAIQESATANINLDTALKNATTEIQSLQNKSSITEIQSAVELVAQQNEERSAKVETLIQGVNPVTSGEKMAMDTLQSALSDHQIQVSEVPKVSAALATLSSKIAEAHQGQTQVTAEMITTLNMSVIQSQQNLRDIQAIKAQLKTPPAIR